MSMSSVSLEPEATETAQWPCDAAPNTACVSVCALECVYVFMPVCVNPLAHECLRMCLYGCVGVHLSAVAIVCLHWLNQIHLKVKYFL